LSHYFTNNSDLESNEKDIYFKILDKEFHFLTDNGVFSKSGLDFGTRLLLETSVNKVAKRMLDFGCGYGPIGLVYKTFHSDSDVHMIDINKRATELATKNAKSMHLDVTVENKDGLGGIVNLYELILSNPPIRAGKTLLQRFLTESYDHLEDGGELVYVIHKNLGAKSSITFCEKIYKGVQVLERKSGYYIILCIK